MAFNITEAQEKTAVAVIDYGAAGNIHLVFYPEKYTPDHEDLVDKIRRDPDAGNADVFIGMMLPLIHQWDITYNKPAIDENGEPVLDKKTKLPLFTTETLPVSADSIRGLPYHVLGDMMRGINKELLPGEAKTTDSSGSFA